MQITIHQCCDWKHMLQYYLDCGKAIITNDETSVHHFDPFTNPATSVGKHSFSSPPKKI